MNAYYVDQDIFQYKNIYHFGTNNYDIYYDFAIDSCFCHADTFQDHDHNLIPYWLVQISECDVQPK